MSKEIRNESDDVKKILKSGFTGDEPTYYDFLILAKHFRQEGFGEVRIKKKIIEFCKNKSKFFSEIYSTPIIKSAVRRAMKHTDYIVNRAVRIYPDELKAIRQVRDFKAQKILFSALVHSKSFYSRNTFSYEMLKSILSSSKTKVGMETFKGLLHVVFDNIIEPKVGRQNSPYFVVKICSDLDDDTFEIEMQSIDELNSSGTIYQDYIGGELSWCVDCGDEIFKASNRHKRCNKCNEIAEKNREERRRKNPPL